MQWGLIFDIGAHTGIDTEYYLSKGFRVIAIDANPGMIRLLGRKYSEDIASHRLALMNVAVSDKDDCEVDLYVSDKSEYTSVKKSVSERGRHQSRSIKVKTRTLHSLFVEFGIPYYCKVDIEGSDALCLATLRNMEQMPPFISVEAECFGEAETPSEEETLSTLNQLHRLGYMKYALVDQYTLSALQPETEAYARAPSTFAAIRRVFRGIALRKKIYTRFVLSTMGCAFPLGASGPLGSELRSEWMDYETARRTYLYHRARCFELMPRNLGSWCDWHAKL